MIQADVPLSLYRAALDTDDPLAWLTRALDEGWSSRQLRDAAGVAKGQRVSSVPLIEAGTEAEVQVWMGGYVGLSIQGFMPSGDIPRMVKLGKVVEVLNPGGYP